MRNRGFTVLIRPPGPTGSLILKPHHRNTTGDNTGKAIKYFNKWLFQMPAQEKICLKHFHKLYNSLPKSIPYYYGVEMHFDQNDNLIRKYCYPIGTGEDEVDALSTHLLTPYLTQPHDHVFREDGYFIKASFVNDELTFSPIQGFYADKVRKAHIKSREKLKRTSLSISIDASPIPTSLKYSEYWATITSKYSADLDRLGVKEGIEKLNSNFKKSETEFYESVKLYQEYKQKQANAQRNSETISLILQGASIISDISSSNARDNELRNQQQNQELYEKQTLKTFHSLKKKQSELEHQLRVIRSEYLRYNIPLNDDPVLEKKWIQLY